MRLPIRPNLTATIVLYIPFPQGARTINREKLRASLQLS